VAVEVWHPGAVWPVVLIMLLSVLAGQVIIALGTRPA
jgi:uncharacterized integral membrane protein